jgi:cytochrome c oxidase subunit II
MMFAQIIWFPEQASTGAAQVDLLLLILVVVCGLVGLMVAGLLIYFSIRYRRRPGDPVPPPMHGNTLLEVFWSTTPLIIFMIFFVLGVGVYFNAYRAPDDATVIYVVGKQWMWKFQHPEGQREINELHVPTGRPFKMLMTSEDVIHSFFVPDFRVHMDVLPGRYTTVWFEANRPGKYHLFCSQYCGTNHSGMIGTVHVMKPEDYQDWLRLKPTGSLAEKGLQTFLRYRCLSCHSADEHQRGPVLEELFGSTVTVRTGGRVRKVLADEEYIKDSILKPGKDVVVGFENIMPTFQGQISAQEINEIIAWLQTLKRGQTPRRNEDFQPPTTTPPINSKK